MYRFGKHLFQHGRTICLISTTALLNTRTTKNEDVKVSAQDDKAESEDKPIDGWDRLALMYSTNEFGELSTELSAVANATTLLFLIGSTYGITKNTREAYLNFVEKNQATQFASVFEAKRKLQDRVLMAAFKGWLEYGIKLTAFSTFLLLGTTTLMVYTGYSSVFHYGLVGSVFGAVFKWKLGPRGMYAGGVVGGVLGLFAGATTNGLLYMFDSSLDDLLIANAEQYKSRQKRSTDLVEKSLGMEAAPKAMNLIEEHDVFAATLNQKEKVSGSKEV
ncbi:hypothetical protein LSTR_LSTR010323 [Laodelphax striatellus]|uniref:Complex I assembly factor TIMMDC1, mitochondrial n=1 Tax=Laodelphax striatellus TaxID=195883 RepID=A0A482X0B5_LAOST|nr:hypothetical protein LSTR_LSTR010323 [Laodelphax striatellus]